VGIGLALMVSRGVRLRLPVWLGLLMAVVAYCLLWPASLVIPGIGDDYMGGVLMIPAFGVAIMAAASRDADGGWGFLHRRLVVKLGQWSFGLYMVHELMLRVARPVVSRIGGLPLRPTAPGRSCG